MSKTPKVFSKLALLILGGLIIRMLLIYFEYSGDVKNHLVWGNSFLESSLGFYTRKFPGFNDPNYPPLAIFLFALCNLFLKTINGLFGYLNNTLPIFPSNLVPLFASENMSMAFLKLPGVLADLGISLLIFKFAKNQKTSSPLLVAALYIFNPAAIYLSSVWGQIEPVTNFFLLASLYFCFVQPKKFGFLSPIFFCLSLLTKQTALWFAPFYIILWFKEVKLGSLLVGVLESLVLFILVYLPFGLWPVKAVINYLSTLQGSSSKVSDAAWNIWYYLFPLGTDDSFSLGSFSIRQFSITILLVLLLFIVISLIRNYSKKKLLTYLFLWSLAVFFLQTRVHERHLSMSLVYLLVLPPTVANLFMFCALSIFHLYNLLYSLGLSYF